jgi:hypothetical protein
MVILLDWNRKIVSTKVVLAQSSGKNLTFIGHSQGAIVAGNGQSPQPHHILTYPIDIKMPSKNGEVIPYFYDTLGGNGTTKTYDNLGNIKLNPNYDREKTIQMIRVMSESVPQGKKVDVRFNDPEVIKYFKGTNLKVIFAGGHDHHLDVRLKEE